ncbi:hypothetical protein AcV7_007347 [Taiwanofungus camphoratus]|nr:hypothetical protein AcV7_007347 [Antrodia cinnamomea]
MPGLITFPPFPKDVPTHPLLTVDYELIKAGDADEIDKLWKAATELGFWYLKNHGTDEEADAMFDVGIETLNLPMSEKMKFEEGDEGIQFGYKAAGSHAADENGTLDATEFLDVAKDDALAWPEQVHRTYPETVNAYMQSAIKPFVRKSLDVNLTLLAVFNTKLGLPEGTLAGLHIAEEHSECVARVIRAPPQPGGISEKALLAAHTDFGSLSVLHNRLGGLQVLAPGTDNWQYVKPLPGHAICNVGDALNIFSASIMRSNMHRVVPPPKEQCEYERYSLAFFTRPHNTVILRALKESSAVADAVARAPMGKFEPGVSARDWLMRRVKNLRINNYSGPESYRSSLGTEDYASIKKAVALV